jgi:hypothetical protein
VDAKNKMKVLMRKEKKESFRIWFRKNQKQQECEQEEQEVLYEEDSELTESMISEMYTDGTFIANKRVSIATDML